MATNQLIKLLYAQSPEPEQALCEFWSVMILFGVFCWQSGIWLN